MVECFCLGCGCVFFWIEPVHGVHYLKTRRLDSCIGREGGGRTYYGDGECSGGDSGDDFVDFVGVDSESVEGGRHGEFQMCFGGKIAWMAS